MRREPVNLDGNSHSGKKIHHSIIYLHLDAIERDTGRVDAIDAVAVVARDARKLTNTLAASLPSIPAGPEHGLVHRLYFNWISRSTEPSQLREAGNWGGMRLGLRGSDRSRSQVPSRYQIVAR